MFRKLCLSAAVACALMFAPAGAFAGHPHVATFAGALDQRISVVAWNEQRWLRLSLLHHIAPRRYMLFKNWMKITGDAAMLGIETQQVMHLRMMKLLAGGPKAQSEALRMVSEKTTALAEATMTLARGGSAQRVIRRYRTHVKSNQRRLSKP